MTQRNRLFLAQALEPSTVAQPPLSAAERMISTDPTCAKHLRSMTTYGQDAIISCVADLLIRDMTARIAAVILRVTGVLDGIEPDDPRGYGLTQTLIADLVNASRPTVVRALASFHREKGWIEVTYGHTRIVAPEAMESFVRASAPSGGKASGSGGEETSGSVVRRVRVGPVMTVPIHAAIATHAVAWRSVTGRLAK
jgi:hypothetical protein